MVSTTVKPTYTLEQVEDDLSELRGQVDAMGEQITVGSISISGTAGTNGTGEITIDSWHSFTPGASWTIPTGGFAQYRLTPENELQISAVIQAPTGSTVNNVTITTFPAGYRPTSTHGFPVGCTLLPATANQSPLMTVTSAGVMQSQGCGGNPGTDLVYIEAKIPLDL